MKISMTRPVPAAASKAEKGNHKVIVYRAQEKYVIASMPASETRKLLRGTKNISEGNQFFLVATNGQKHRTVEHQVTLQR